MIKFFVIAVLVVVIMWPTSSTFYAPDRHRFKPMQWHFGFYRVAVTPDGRWLRMRMPWLFVKLEKWRWLEALREDLQSAPCRDSEDYPRSKTEWRQLPA